jgi:hypothetical protein
MAILNTGIVAPTGGYQISRSLRFNSADSAYLNRTPASAGNRKTWTWSGWVKRGRLGVNTTQTLFGAGNNDGTDSGVLTLLFLDSNVLQLGTYQTKLETTQVFRDPSAWYHIICAVDTTQSGITNQAKLYVNGVQITQFSTSNAFSASVNTPINNTIQHEIGRQPNATSRYFDGYLTEINFIDGQALTPSSFGETDTVTGVWTPKKYTGSYGTNGFYLNFSDNSGTTSTTLGKDSSGNGNNWTPNNFSVTAGVGNDSMVDVPTRWGTDTGVGGEVRGNYATLNPLSVTNGTFFDGNLRFDGANEYKRANATISVTSGKWYWEVTLTTSPVSTSFAQRYNAWGFGNPAVFNSNSSDPTDCFIYWDTSQYRNYSSTLSSGSALTSGDVLAFAVDVDANTVSVYKNNVAVLSGVTLNKPIGEAIVPFRLSYDDAVWSQSYINFGQRPFAYTAPAGFKALCTTNLPTPTIADGGEYFNAVLYTGNSSTQSITGVGFQPDFVWIKDRSAVTSHVLFDAIRGVQKYLVSNTTDAEGTLSTTLTAFNSDGFTYGTNGSGNALNDAYVAWNWKANGAGSTNTAGTITSTVSVNTTSGFSIVTYTGNGTAGATVGHGLGVAPSMVVFKKRNGISNFVVYHSSLGNTKAIFLDLTNAPTTSSSYFNSTSPTSTTLSLGIASAVNDTSSTHVAYCFAPLSGFSSMGSYVGNGSADGPFVFVNHRPAFLLIKRTDTTSNWTILDFAREGYNVDNDPLYPNLSNAEGTTDLADLLSNGFKLRSTDASVNASGGAYIYMSLASNPFIYSLAR